MKKLLFITIAFLTFFSACKKENTTNETTLHGTRLKTYTKSYGYDDKYVIYYNNFNKIDRVENLYEDGSIYKTSYCVYKSDHSLDSIIVRHEDGSLYYAENIEFDGFRIINIDGNIISYNNDGVIIKNDYGSGYYTYEYSGDSVSIYDNVPGTTKTIFSKLKFTKAIKNPFVIKGFEPESIILGKLIPWLNYSVYVPYTMTQLNSAPYIFNYTYDGNFNGYPTSRLRNDGLTETFTYEEF